MTRAPDPELADQWRDRLRRFNQADQSVAQFCADEDYSTASFYYWRRRIADEQPKSAGAFVAVQLGDPAMGHCRAEHALRMPSDEQAIRIEPRGGGVLRLCSDASEDLLRRSLAAVLAVTSGEASA